MAASAAAQPRFYSAPGRVATWVRQGIESFVAAQKILFDLTAQQNALMIGMVRERVKIPDMNPGPMLVNMANQGVAGLTGAGKILLDFAAGETALAVDGLKDALRMGPATSAVADIVRYRAETLIDMHRRLLDGVAGQIEAMAESYHEGKGLSGGSDVAELARKAMESFVQTEKRFLNYAVEQVTEVAQGKETRKSTRDRSRILSQLARDSMDKYVEAQKKLMELAIHQFEAERKIATDAVSSATAGAEPRTSMSELTQKSVKNFVAAEKSLLELAVKPVKPGEPQAQTATAGKTRARKAKAKRASA